MVEDPRLWATALHDEVVKLGYDRSYSAFTRALRLVGLRPACEPCHPAKGRPVAVIDHPAGEETQWDWVELPDPPAGWDGYGKRAYLLVGALFFSSKWRGVLCESMEQPQLAEAQYRVAVKLGGVTKDWRFDRMATVVRPGSGTVTASYAPIAKHFGVRVRPCPPRRGNRKGVVEKANHSVAQRWWRSLADDVTAAAAQRSLDELCEQIADDRTRIDAAGNRCTVADLAAAEPLRPVPEFPPVAVVGVHRTVSAQALVSFRGNTYSVPPGHIGAQLSITHRLGSATLSISTTAGVTVAVHARRPDGAGATIRAEAHVTAFNVALEMAAAGLSTGPIALLGPCFSRRDEALVIRVVDRLARVLGHLRYTAMRRVLHLAVKQSPLPPDRLEVLVTQLQMNDPRSMRRGVHAYLKYLDRHGSVASRLGACGVPAWVVHGESGDGRMTDDERRTLQAYASTHIVTIPGPSFFTANEEPALVAGFVVEALQAATAGTIRPRPPTASRRKNEPRTISRARLPERRGSAIAMHSICRRSSVPEP